MTYQRKFTNYVIPLAALALLLSLSTMLVYAQDNNDTLCGFDPSQQSDGWNMMGGSGNMGQFGPGADMMGGHMGMMSGSMMGGWQPPADLAPAESRLTLEEAEKVALAYLNAWDAEQTLELGEVMQFDNHFYAVAEEAETGHGAFEFLIDPQTGYVIGEPGPNMMWNLKYGMMMGHGMGFSRARVSGEEMNVSVEEARSLAQACLDEVLPGTSVDAEEADTFYGYYTLHVLEEGEIIGMLSVNGFTGQVWLHRWHGDFVAMTEHK
jgi:hypothetical protein